MGRFLKKDLALSLILGEASSWFLLFVIKNPYIREFERLVFLERAVWFLPLALPIVFLSGIIFAQVLSRVIKIVYQIAKFVEVGILNTVIDFGILNLLIWLTGITGGFAIAPLNAVSFLCATINSYFWNKFWTFEKGRIAAKREFAQFLIISVIGIGANTGIVVVGTALIPPFFGISAGGWANLVKILATFISMTWNFLGYKFIVFRHADAEPRTL